MSTHNVRRRRAAKSQKKSLVFLGIFGVIVALCGVGVFVILVVGSAWLVNLPDYSSIDQYAKSGYSTILASDRQTVLGKLYLENRIEVASNQVTTDTLNAAVATEDERFYKHGGVDAFGIVRAVVVNTLLGRSSEGASTITQQLVRNTLLLDEMNDISVKRKVREMYLACKVEELYTKEQILMMYLNVVNFGDNCYGVEAAARNYFGVSAKDLTLSQTALLIGIPQSPTANNPRQHYDSALARRTTVLNRMLRNGYITQEQYDSTINEQPEIADKKTTDEEINDIAPYFVDYIRYLINNDARFSSSDIARGGLTIYTTLDVNCQNAANDAINNSLEYRNNNLDASLVSIDPDNGNIVAMVGGKDYEKDQFNLATQMNRQAGSSFKTFTLLAALAAGVDPDTTFNSDSPAYIEQGEGKEYWQVKNVEGEGGGRMSITTATIKSVNTVYARLAHALGPDKIVEMAKACGITSDLEAYDSISLGAQGVNTLEMADAYATIANGGTHYDAVAIREISDNRGTLLYTAPTDNGTRVMSEAVAQEATEILERVISSGTGTSAALSSGQPTAGKTGTSENSRDLWFCGITPQYSTAIWCGYREERSTGSYGGTICAPIWKNYMKTVLKDAPVEKFPSTDEEIEYKDDVLKYNDKGTSKNYSSSTSGSSSSSSRSSRTYDDEEEEE